MIKKIFLISLIFPVMLSCKEDNSKEISDEMAEVEVSNESVTHNISADRPDLNISILMDLSDRIDPKLHPNSTMEYYQRDVGYIKSIVDNFENHLRNKRSIKMNDFIQLYIDPEPSDKELNSKLNELKLEFDRHNATKDYILSASDLYGSISNDIYLKAIEDDNYVGSDIWRFFKGKVHDYCIKPDFKNVLVILTDGYIYHEDTKIKDGNLSTYLTPKVVNASKLNTIKWKEIMEKEHYGYIPATDGLQNLNVLVLGINANKQNPFEEDIVKKYWSDWLGSMGVENYEIKTAELPSNMESIIEKFILN
ncbi:hypothetical protein [Mangrovimonas sp. DI 80]|uniref:hypothetical protein n=1 Tax=Mangrovimonas sp. DI 80 TaxID=1779330 RepID=UPI000F4FD8F5|nr:hypothetical protein [Mangrovimonas sp. DI 80]